MYHRFLTLLFACTIVAAGVLRAAQAPSAAQDLKIERNEVWATAIEGDVWMTLGGVKTQLKARIRVPVSATINTGGGSSKVILIFSNKAQTQIGADSELQLEKYQEDLNVIPDAVVDDEVEALKSDTVLTLNKGELVGKVKLRKDRNSTFTIKTPVGAAGIRGTTFRIVYRPPGTGQQFGTFTLTNANGSVDFAPTGSGGSTGSGGAGGGTPGTPTSQEPTPGSPAVSATGTVSGVDLTVIPQGQQIEIVVTQNAQGQFVAQTPVTSSSATVVPTAVLNQIASISIAIAEQVQQVVIAAPPLPPAPPPPTPPAGTPPTTQTETPPTTTPPTTTSTTTAPVSTQAAGATATGTVTVTPPQTPAVPPAPRVTNPGSG